MDMNGVTFDIESRRLIKGELMTRLTPSMVYMLRVFWDQPRVTLSIPAICTGYHCYSGKTLGEGTVKVYVTMLREAIYPFGLFIYNEMKVGYSLIRLGDINHAVKNPKPKRGNSEPARFSQQAAEMCAELRNKGIPGVEARRITYEHFALRDPIQVGAPLRIPKCT